MNANHRLHLAGISVGLLAASLVGCGDNAPNQVTFTKDISPLIQKHCLGCHADGQIAGFTLGTYEQAKDVARSMAAKTRTREMPPWLAQDAAACTPRLSWRNDLSLTDDEIAMFGAWAEQGMPEGNAADAPAPFEPPSTQLKNVSLEIPAAAVDIPAASKDQYLCLLFDPKMTETKYIDGLHFVPGNTKIAHHALIYRADRTKVLEQAGGKDVFPCFGNADATLLNAWAPGGMPLELPNDVGIRLGAQDVLVVQMHYHPRTTTETDQSKLQMHFGTKMPTWAYITALPGNAKNASKGLLPGEGDTDGVPEFRIPANATNHVEEMTYEIPSQISFNVPILAVGTHMHYAGKAMRFSIERKTVSPTQPANECFVETPAYNFNWQRTFQYDGAIDELPTAVAGDVLRMRCEYNNSSSNAAIQDALGEQGLTAPKDIVLGEQTLDEMCLGVLGLLVPAGLNL